MDGPNTGQLAAGGSGHRHPRNLCARLGIAVRRSDERVMIGGRSRKSSNAILSSGQPPFEGSGEPNAVSGGTLNEPSAGKRSAESGDPKKRLELVGQRVKRGVADGRVWLQRTRSLQAAGVTGTNPSRTATKKRRPVASVRVSPARFACCKSGLSTRRATTD